SFVPSGGGARQITVFSIGAGTGIGGAAPQIDSGGWTPYMVLPFGEAFSRPIVATQTDATTRHVVLGALPPGITLEGSALVGAPTQAGLFIAEMAVTNLHGFARLPVVFFVPATGGGAPPVLTAPEAI